MIFAVDVNYIEDKALVAGILFEYWQGSETICQITTKINNISEYEPGQFWLGRWGLLDPAPPS